MSTQEMPTCDWCGRYMHRHMDAYYYGFAATGVPEIDSILCSVASAGKAYHHTEYWGNPSLEGGTNYVTLIQRAADEAAKAMRAALEGKDGGK